MSKVNAQTETNCVHSCQRIWMYGPCGQTRPCRLSDWPGGQKEGHIKPWPVCSNHLPHDEKGFDSPKDSIPEHNAQSGVFILFNHPTDPQEPFEEDDEEFYMFCEAGLFEECYRYWLDYEGRSIKKFVPCKSWNDFDEANENGHRIDDFEEV